MWGRAMSRDVCKMPGCDREPGTQDDGSTYRTRWFCSVKHDLKYEHLKADADDARLSVEGQ